MRLVKDYGSIAQSWLDWKSRWDRIVLICDKIGASFSNSLYGTCIIILIARHKREEIGI